LLSFGFRMRAVGTESAGQGAVAACRDVVSAPREQQIPYRGGGIEVAMLAHGDAFGVVGGVPAERLVQASAVLPHQLMPTVAVRILESVPPEVVIVELYRSSAGVT